MHYDFQGFAYAKAIVLILVKIRIVLGIVHFKFHNSIETITDLKKNYGKSENLRV